MRTRSLPLAWAAVAAWLGVQACAADSTVVFPDGDDPDAANASSSGVSSSSGNVPGGDGGGSSSGVGASSSSSGTPPPECIVPTDCPSGVCTASKCQPPTSTDLVMNGTETDVDCGGGAPTNAAPCALDLKCAVHADCMSDACAYTGTCIAEHSCTQHLGGDTCGKGADVGEQVDENVSCCARAPIENSTVVIDRFLMTAGRMRAFIEHLGGDVRSYVTTLPAEKWDQSWNELVPASVLDANVMLGPRWVGAPNDPDTGSGPSESKRACAAPDANGHTYWIPTAPLVAGDREDSYDANQQYTQAQLDAKALNCVSWYLAKALCTWDGGRLATHAEIRNAFTNGGLTTYPWEFAGGSAPYDPGVADERLNHEYVYQMPAGVSETLDMTAKISPPGRFYLGYNAHDVEVAGNTLEWADDLPRHFTWTLSFEAHGSQDPMDNWGNATPTDRELVPNGYYALGARCAYDPQ